MGIQQGVPPYRFDDSGWPVTNGNAIHLVSILTMLQEQLNYTINWNTNIGEIDLNIMRINCCQNGKPGDSAFVLYNHYYFILFFLSVVAAVCAFCIRA